MSDSPPAPVRVVGGIVSFDDGERVGWAIDSLLEQSLPAGFVLDRVWVVAGGRDPRTVESARSRAAADTRVSVIEEPIRRGKSAALAELLQRAEGEYVVLLNGDAAAEPGAIRALLAATPAGPGPFGVMGRPVVAGRDGSLLHRALALLWQIHHELHDELARRKELTHLSDELLLLPIAALPPFPRGLVCDGSYAAGWILAQGGTLRYAAAAQVRLTLPVRLSDHILQRRRIRAGYRHGPEEAAAAASSIEALVARDPSAGLRLLLRSSRKVRHGGTALGVLMVAELWAMALSGWDAAVQVDHGTWTRIAVPPLPRTEPPGRALRA